MQSLKRRVYQGLLFHYFGTKKKLYWYAYNYALQTVTSEFYDLINLNDCSADSLNINKMLDGTDFLPELSSILGGARNAFLAILAYILTQILTAYAIMSILRIREEESLTRAEWILSGAGSRIRYAAGHLLIAFLGGTAAMAFFGLYRFCFLHCAAARSVAHCFDYSLYGIAPRVAAPVNWGLFGALLLLEFLWEIRVIGNSVFAFSPFAWVYPGVAISSLSVFIMLLATAMLVGLGLFCFSRRDIVAE